jgi:hypothetical protein
MAQRSSSDYLSLGKPGNSRNRALRNVNYHFMFFFSSQGSVAVALRCCDLRWTSHVGCPAEFRHYRRDAKAT